MPTCAANVSCEVDVLRHKLQNRSPEIFTVRGDFRTSSIVVS
jgi:hypothetical protein